MACHFFKRTNKTTVAVEAYTLGYFGDLVIGFKEQALGAVNADITQIIAAVRTNRAWATRRGLTSDYELPRNAAIVQERPSGTRLRVIANRDRSLLVLQTSRGEQATPFQVTTACDLAIEVIRAVPGLRWGAVDLVISGEVGTLAEGMSLNPRLSSANTVVAGSLDAVEGYLLSPSSAAGLRRTLPHEKVPPAPDPAPGPGHS